MNNLLKDLQALQQAENDVQMWVRIYSQLLKTREDAKKRLTELYNEKSLLSNPITSNLNARKKALVRLIGLKAQN